MSNKKKVFIGVGHGGSDPGAVCNQHQEARMNLVTALACRDELVSHGVDVKMSRSTNENDTVNDEVKECNAFNPILAIDIHKNSGGGDGFEVYRSKVGGLGTELAKNIESEVVAIGQNSRGVKTKLNDSGKDYFAFIRNTNCHAVILEGAFIDNPTDVQIVDTDEELKTLGRAYARGVLKTLGIAYKPTTTPPVNNSDKPKYIVATGAFNNIDNARAEVNKLKGMGLSSAYVHDCSQFHK